MISRKKFLGLSALGTMGGIATMTASSSYPPKKENDHFDSLPPSIERLTSMQDKVHPITTAERVKRVKKAKHLMQENNIDAIVIMGGSSLKYFSGITWGVSERMLALVIPREKDTFIVCPYFEESRAMEQIKDSPFANIKDILTWQEHESPYRLVIQGLRDRNIAKGKIGIEEETRFLFSNGIDKANENPLTLVSATPVTAGCRSVKSDRELALMRIASQATYKAYEAAYEAAKIGMNQDEFSTLIAQAHHRLGFKGFAMVQIGKWAALPHGSQTPQTIKENEVVLIDGGCQVEGYWSDLSRTFVLGKPSRKVKEAFEIDLEAQTTALKAARPGIEAQQVDAAARKVITDAGYGPEYKYFTHRLGHGIGLDMHEWHYLVKGNKTILQPGHTFSNEPGIYVPDEFGIRVEDDMVITEDGAEFLSPQTPSLEDPFGKPHKI